MRGHKFEFCFGNLNFFVLKFHLLPFSLISFFSYLSLCFPVCVVRRFLCLFLPAYCLSVSFLMSACWTYFSIFSQYMASTFLCILCLCEFGPFHLQLGQIMSRFSCISPFVISMCQSISFYVSILTCLWVCVASTHLWVCVCISSFFCRSLHPYSLL